MGAENIVPVATFYVLLRLKHHTRMYIPTTYVLPVTNSVGQGGSAYEEALLY